VLEPIKSNPSTKLDGEYEFIIIRFAVDRLKATPMFCQDSDEKRTQVSAFIIPEACKKHVA